MAIKKMKAVMMRSRGGPENLIYDEISIPEISEGEVLIKVHALGITPTELDWNSTFTTADGKDRLSIIPGFEVAGIVESKSPEIKHLAVGDSVYGLLDFWQNGSAAEYVAVKASGIALKPKSLDYPAAASIPLSGLTAWQALFEHASLSSGERVLIHGAGGGVGSLAVQLAHWRGAHVVGTCSGTKFDFVRNLGADEVIDYRSVKFEDQLQNMDVVLDTVGGKLLRDRGKLSAKAGLWSQLQMTLQKVRRKKLELRESQC